MGEAIIRKADARDIEAIHRLQFDAYPNMSKVAAWQKEHLVNHQGAFPEGQFVAEVDGRIVGYCANLITRSQVALNAHRYATITGRGSLSTHDPQGDALYGAEIMVHPDFRRQGIARSFYERRFALCRQMKLRYFLSGGRLPGFADHKDKSIEKYVASVLRGEVTDRTLSAQIAVGLCVRSILPDYINDPNSSNYATLLAWENPDQVQPGSAPLCPATVGVAPQALEEALRTASTTPPTTAW